MYPSGWSTLRTTQPRCTEVLGGSAEASASRSWGKASPACVTFPQTYFFAFSAPFYVRTPCPNVGDYHYLDAYGAGEAAADSGTRTREVQHLTQWERILAHQAAPAWTTRQARWRRLAAITDGTLQQRRAQPGALDTKPAQGTEELLALVAPAAPDFRSEDNEPLRPSACR
eukprot:s6284_g5.t1